MMPLPTNQEQTFDDIMLTQTKISGESLSVSNQVLATFLVCVFVTGWWRNGEVHLSDLSEGVQLGEWRQIPY